MWSWSELALLLKVWSLKTAASPGSSLEMQNPRPIPAPSRSDTSEVGAQPSVLKKKKKKKKKNPPGGSDLCRSLRAIKLSSGLAWE